LFRSRYSFLCSLIAVAFSAWYTLIFSLMATAFFARYSLCRFKMVSLCFGWYSAKYFVRSRFPAFSHSLPCDMLFGTPSCLRFSILWIYLEGCLLLYQSQLVERVELTDNQRKRIRAASGGKPTLECRMLWHTSLEVWRGPARWGTVRIKNYIFRTHGKGFA
jgi:hypothetical protein